MPRPYSVDLRQRVMAAVDEGHAPGDVAVQYQITERTIWNWLALREETGKLAPREGDVGRGCHLEKYVAEARVRRVVGRDRVPEKLLTRGLQTTVNPPVTR